jgi:hypothetical protein
MGSRTVDLCYDCHDYIHTVFTEKELGCQVNTPGALLADEKVGKFVDWVKKQPQVLKRERLSPPLSRGFGRRQRFDLFLCLLYDLSRSHLPERRVR